MARYPFGTGFGDPAEAGGEVRRGDLSQTVRLQGQRVQHASTPVGYGEFKRCATSPYPRVDPGE